MKIIGIEEQEERKLNKNKVSFTGIAIIIALIILFIVIMYLANRNFKEFMDKYVLMKNVVEDNVTSISIDEAEISSACAYDKYVSVFTGNKLVGYGSSGKKEYELDVEISNPLIDTNNRFLLIGEKDGQKLYLISENTIVWEQDLEGNISRVSVNKNGYVSVVLTGTTYKSIIQTISPSGEKLFKTYLSSSLVVDTDISNDNRYLSFAEVSTNGTLVQSMIKTIEIAKTDKESKINTLSTESDKTILNLKYQDGNKLVCMYNDSIQLIEEENVKEICKIDQDGRKTIFAGIELSNSIYSVIEKNSIFSTETMVELINTGNESVNVYTLDSGIKEVYTYNNQLALNLGSEVHFIGSNGWLSRRYISKQEVRKIIMASNFAGIVYKDKIEIVEF